MALPESGWYLRRAADMDTEKLPIVDLTITDPENFPGKTFTGTAESIYNEMKALKPALFADVSVTETSISLEKRGAPVRHSPDFSLPSI